MASSEAILSGPVQIIRGAFFRASVASVAVFDEYPRIVEDMKRSANGEISYAVRATQTHEGSKLQVGEAYCGLVGMIMMFICYFKVRV